VAPVAETAIEWLTPVDDVSNAAKTGTAGSAATAGLNFLPGFKGGKKAAQKAAEALPALREEVTSLMGQLYAMTKQARPLPGSFEKPEVQMKGLREAKEWAEKELAAVRAAQPTARTSVPATTTPEREYLLKEIRKNPYVQAIPGRQGFPKKAEQEAFAKQFSGELPASPWGRSAVDDIRYALSEAVAAGKKISNQAKEAAEKAAKKSDDAAKELEDLRLKASVAEGRGQTILRLRDQLRAAEKKAESAQRNLDAVLSRINKATDSKE
jgi:predicted  nucleic acid-binding Zn-ribbon protein